MYTLSILPFCEISNIVNDRVDTLMHVYFPLNTSIIISHVMRMCLFGVVSYNIKFVDKSVFNTGFMFHI